MGQRALGLVWAVSARRSSSGGRFFYFRSHSQLAWQAIRLINRRHLPTVWVSKYAAIRFFVLTGKTAFCPLSIVIS